MTQCSAINGPQQHIVFKSVFSQRRDLRSRGKTEKQTNQVRSNERLNFKHLTGDVTHVR